MPKLKTKRVARKKFRITGTGKFKHPKMNRNHILGKKSPKRKMKLRRQAMVDSTNEAAVRKMLPYHK